MIPKIEFDHKEFLKDTVIEEDAGKEWYLSDDYYSWYYTYGFTIKPKSIFEVGVRYGYSMVCMIKGAIDAGVVPELVIGIDNEEDHGRSNTAALQSLNSLFPEINVQLITKNVYRGLPKIDHKFDLIHIDAAHHVYPTIHHLDQAYRMLNPGGYIVIDDMGSKITYGISSDTCHKAVQDFLLYRFRECKQYAYINNFRGHVILQVP